MFENLHAARSKTPFGPFEDIRRLYPYFSIDPHVVKTEEGVGHNSVIFYENEYYAVYHGRDLGEDPSMESDRRTARICRLKFRDGYIEAIR